ncbi:unnamed protein product [marine sediment metagenome]|uniref:Uncharacterized protein n=1 Tax=marine sediment metagenome TaxID=412755 RepID=X1JKN2_9ZZZZ
MAKLKAPLFSFGASGAIGKSLVYFGWKGIDVVREYVVPVNPKSTKQMTQRNLLTAAVKEFHDAGYDDDDITAWKLFASTFPTPRTAFNAMVRAHLMCALGGGDWIRFHDVTVTPGDPGESTVTCKTDATEVLHVRCLYGYSKSSVVGGVFADTIVAGLATFTIPALVEGKEVYLFMIGSVVTYKEKTYYGGRTGIYHYTALAA